MGRQGDYARKEKKKSRKDLKKVSPVIITSAPVEVEVIRKKRKSREEEES